MSVSDRLKSVRLALGEGQRSMSKRLGLGPNGWANHEREGKLPKHETLEQLAAMGFSIDWLLTGKGAMWLPSANRADAAVERGQAASEVGRGEAILRSLPQYPIPQEFQEALDFIASLLKKGPRNYAVAHFNVLHLASLIDEVLKRKETESKSDPTKTSMP